VTGVVYRHGDFRDTPGLPIISKVVVYNDLAYTSGFTGQPGGDIAAQTGQALEQLDEVLKAVGASRSSIVSAQVWLADMADFPAHNAVWDAWVDPASAPARACVGAQLFHPDVLVEIRAVAVVEGPGAGR
jgi:enamine deaminase RidA (YjgF/YER057c/UK114 family)